MAEEADQGSQVGAPHAPAPRVGPSGLYRIKLPVFEGPLDLLLHLIKKNEVEIVDIPIAAITEQYLAYLEMMRQLNLDIAGEFLVMAATLTLIKSRSLLPPSEGGEEEEEADPRADLVRQLLDYQRYREAALAFRAVLKRARPEAVHEIVAEQLSLRDRVRTLLQALSVARSIEFDSLFDEDASRADIIVTFLALLELMKMGAIRATQEERYGRIVIDLAVSDITTVSLESVDEYETRAAEEGAEDERTQ
jgi:segregation and condensation protein A